MRLEEWRGLKGWTYERLGDELGINTEPARRLCRPPADRLRTRPSVEMLVKIERLTEGAVKAEDFIYEAGEGAAA